MKQDLSELVIVSDRSGSMSSSREESQNAINRMISDQKDAEGECRLTFVEFDDLYDIVHDGIDVKEAPEYVLEPRGLTALYDAVGKAVSTVGSRLAKTPEAERPALVTLVISTDGHNNASKEYNRNQVAKMLKEQQEKYSWQVIFLGVEIDEQVAVDMNININNAVNIKRSKSSAAYAMTSSKLMSARNAVVAGADAKAVSGCMAYSDDEKLELASD